MEYDEFRAMNTTIQVAAEGSRPDLAPGFRQVRAFVAESEQRFSRFREDSELSQLNRASGTWFQASPELFDLVEESLELHHQTWGLFDPAILRALVLAGYDRSMDEIRRTGPRPYEPEAVKPPPFADTALDRVQCAIHLPYGLQIDLGGIAKGWIAARAVELLANYSDACLVSAGGDMVMRGRPLDQPAWPITLDDPRDGSRALAVLNVGPGALATSAVTRRTWRQGGTLRHHIIDPRTRVPAERGWLSVSVTARRATVAEAYAKVILIAGPGEGPDMARRVPGLRYLAIRPDGSMEGTFKDKEVEYVPEIYQSV